MINPQQASAFRLDANETVWFSRQLEYVDKTLYETIFPENKARTLIPTQQGIPDWAKVYTWRQFERFGKAKIVANMADDIPRADHAGVENSKIIKPLTASYGWDIFEVKAAAATGMPLDTLKATAARFAIEAGIDEVLAIGSPEHNLQGLLTLDDTTDFTPVTKDGGGTTWDVATPDEIVGDVFKAIANIISTMKQAGGPVFSRFTVVLPVEQYGIIAQKRMGGGSDVTILRFLLQNSPWIESIEPWYHAAGAGAGDTDRMVIYPRNPLVIAGIVPMEFSSQPPDQRNLEFVVNCIATVGGVVVRYPLAVAYVDGI